MLQTQTQVVGVEIEDVVNINNSSISMQQTPIQDVNIEMEHEESIDYNKLSVIVIVKNLEMGKRRQRHEHPSCGRKRSSRSKIARLRWSIKKKDEQLNSQESLTLQAEVQVHSEPCVVQDQIYDQRMPNENLIDVTVQAGPSHQMGICNRYVLKYSIESPLG
ncbi:hypothetical protein FQR65_LT14561 [Abscondita terminalis]|nr:hypothetical protein FQR65_LT14561 [Abscondita terminalis]